MSLPPGFLDELRARVPLSRVVGRKVVWDLRKSNQAKGDWWAPCPFHHEKTPSFHVDDQKGFYYCFGCHAKGDALGFLKETENLGFMEAVEALAREAGMPMPARDPAERQKADRRGQLAEVMERAVRFFRMQLQGARAAEARAYLARRGLAQSGLDRFEIGFAPDARQALWTHLAEAGVAPDLVIDAGLAARPDDGGAPFDRFRGRIMFPIRDGRGRCIAFGGRAMAADARAKYLNSPETELFDKGRTLYNLGPARAACAKGAPLLVAEGYMDVIALSEAGFAGAVAPLGTAITEDQLAMLWRVSPEPVVALDGDKAGLRAAERLMDLALPRIEAGQALRFAILPEGMDPDDLIRARGAQAMQAVLDAAVPMVTLLWRRETEGRVFDSPERRAAFDKALRERLRQIADPTLRGHYGEEIARLRAELFRSAAPTARPRAPGSRGAFASGWRNALPQPALQGTQNSALARDGLPPERLREARVLAVCAAHPELIATFAAELESLEMADPAHDLLRNALLALPGGASGGAAGTDLLELLSPEARAALETLRAQRHVAIVPQARPEADPETAARCVADDLGWIAARRGSEREVREAMEDIDSLADEGITWRLRESVRLRHAAERTALSDKADLGENGAELSSRLDAMIRSEVWIRKR